MWYKLKSGAKQFFFCLNNSSLYLRPVNILLTSSFNIQNTVYSLEKFKRCILTDRVTLSRKVSRLVSKANPFSSSVLIRGKLENLKKQKKKQNRMAEHVFRVKRILPIWAISRAWTLFLL